MAKRKSVNDLPLFRREPLPLDVIECYRCDHEFVGSMWEIRCGGWDELSKVEGRLFGMCRKCVEIDKQLKARGYKV